MYSGFMHAIVQQKCVDGLKYIAINYELKCRYENLINCPHVIYKNFEGGKVKSYIDGLQNWVLDNNERSDKEHELAKNVVENIGQLKGWCLQLVAARTLYLVSKDLQSLS